MNFQSLHKIKERHVSLVNGRVSNIDFNYQLISDLKRRMEEAVIGAVVLENYIPKGADLLKQTHFGVWQCYWFGVSTPTEVNHKMIWQAILDMYGNHPIDLLTVSNYCMGKWSVNVAAELAMMTSKVTCSANAGTHALMLIETDVEMKFLKMITTMSESGELSDSERMLLMEAHKEIRQHEIDLFDGITAVKNMLRTYHFPERMVKKVVDFEMNVTEGIEGVKKNNANTLLFDNLMSMAKHKENKEDIINKINELKNLLL